MSELRIAHTADVDGRHNARRSPLAREGERLGSLSYERAPWTSGRSRRGAVPHACLRQRLQQPTPAPPTLARIFQSERVVSVSRAARSSSSTSVAAAPVQALTASRIRLPRMSRRGPRALVLTLCACSHSLAGRRPISGVVHPSRHTGDCAEHRSQRCANAPAMPGSDHRRTHQTQPRTASDGLHPQAALTPPQRGPEGPPGPTGPSGVSGWSYHTQGHTIGPEDYATGGVDCPTAKRALGGGVAASGRYVGNIRHSAVVQSAPAGAATGWVVTYSNEFSEGNVIAYAWVICANVTS
jgi:hypothetical protein